MSDEEDIVTIQMKREYANVLLNHISNNLTVQGLQGATALIDICNALSNSLDESE